MHPLLQALLSAWEWRIETTVLLLTMGTLYTVGWRRLRSRSNNPKLATKRKLVAYLSGLATLAIAFMSPVDPLGGQLLFMHMVQHKLVIMIAAPLLWLANPFPFSMWGLPIGLRKRIGALFTQDAGFRLFLKKITNPGIAWLAFITLYMGWHDPNAYNLALRNSFVHDLEHISFFAAAMLFWWHIVGAAPHIHGNVSPWARLAMLIGVIPPTMIAGIVIATAPNVIYTYYETVPRIWGFTALQDQAIGGVIMWIPSSEMIVWGVVFLLAGAFKKEDQGLPHPVPNWDDEEKMVAPGLEHRARQNKWRKLAEARAHAATIQ